MVKSLVRRSQLVEDIWGHIIKQFNKLVNTNSTEDMILALAGQFKQLSHEPEKFR